ncbi:MAG: TIGR01459 family HAD-type hydrolase [Pseudomonadota bacterium]
MAAPTKLTNLSDIAHQYDALLCDAWGVIHNGRTLFDGVESALVNFRKKRGPVIILTNAPKPSSVIPGQLDHLGLSREAYDHVVTSGEATRQEILKRLPSKAYHIGWLSDSVLFDGIPIEFSGLNEAGFIVCTGIAENGPAEPDEYRPILESAAEAGKPMICGNPDIVVNWRGDIMWCAGAIARVYESLGGSVIYAGKPYAAVYDLALRLIAEVSGKAIPNSRVLAIGDGVETDIKGANSKGIDAIFISGAGGIYRGGAAENDVASALDRAGVTAIASMETLKW